MFERTDLFIGGEWVDGSSGATIEAVSATTEEVIGRVPEAGPADVDRAVAAARHAFDEGSWAGLPVEDRIAALGRFSAALTSRTDDIADLLSSEVGSPRSWAGFGQVGIATAVFETYRHLAGAYPWVETRPGAMKNPVRVRSVPVGVIGAIVPWNAPLFVAAMKLAPALVAGCTVVLKPSPDAALDPYLLAEAAIEAGLPPGVLNIVTAGAEGSEHLVRHPDVDKISFTGSTGVGRRVGELCGRDLKRCTLELGGKSASIVLDDAELDGKLIGNLVSGAMANNGQVCAALSRVLVPRSRHDELADAIADAVGAMQVGDPFAEGTDVGPLATRKQRDRVEQLVKGAVDDGARAAVGGGRPAGLDQGWFIEPTVFTGVDNSMTIAQEEVFGPVITVIPFEDEDDAVRIANDSRYGLVGAVFSADVDRAESVAARLRTGSVGVNSSAAMDFGSPFGGFKQSGIGRELGPEGIAACTELQTVVLPRPPKKE